MSEAKIREYRVVINGVEQSISQVESLNRQLDELEKRLDKVASRTINVTTSSSGGGGGGKSTAELDQEAKLQKEISATLDKAATARSEEYQNLLKAKAELKEYQEVAKSIHAQENLLTSQNDLSTMRGMKAELKDIKQAMQTMDVDSEGFKILSQQAGELTEKLKQLETAYGQYGRNVGNYQSAFDAQEFQTLKIEVNGVTREFTNAREALRTLQNERNTLKLLGEDVGDLDKVVKTLQSDIKDMNVSSAGMDNLLDTMEGIVALSSTAKGLATVFGMDDSAIEKSIQQLMALQNALQGIEVIKKQMQTGEGIGGWLTKGNDAIDRFVQRIFRLDKAQQAAAKSTSATTVATKAQAAASKTADAANKATTTSTVALTTAQRAATAAATALGVALKAIGIGVILAGITALMSAYDKWQEKTQKAKEAQEKLGEVAAAGAAAAAEAGAKMKVWTDRIDSFNGSADKEKKLVESLNKEYGDSIGKYKTLAEWKKQLTDRGAQYIRMLQLEAQAQASLAIYTQAAQDAMKASLKSPEEYLNWFEKAGVWVDKIFGTSNFSKNATSNAFGRQSKEIAANNKLMNEALKNFEDYQKQADEIRQKFSFNEYSSADGKAKSKAEVDALKRLNELKIKAMKEGREKVIAEIEEERRQRLYEISKSGSATAEKEEKLVNDYFDNKLVKALADFNKKAQDAFDKMWQGINDSSKKGLEQELENIKKAGEEAEKAFREQPKMANSKSRAFPSYQSYGVNSRGYSRSTQRDLGLMGDLFEGDIPQEAKEYVKLQREYIKYTQLLEAAKTQLITVQDQYNKASIEEKDNIKQELEVLQRLSDEFQEQVDNAEIAVFKFLDANEAFSKGDFSLQNIFNDFAAIYNEQGWVDDLDATFDQRLTYIKDYYAQLIKIVYDATEEQKAKELEVLKRDYEGDKTAENQRWEAWEEAQEEALAKGLITKEEYDEASAQASEAHIATMLALEKKYEADKEKIRNDGNKRLKQLTTEEMQAEIDEYQEFSNAIVEMENSLPRHRNIMGMNFIDVKASKKETQEIISNYQHLYEHIQSQKVRIGQLVRNGIIDEPTMKESLAQFDKLQQGIGYKMDENKEKMDDYGEELAGQINEMVSVLGSHANDFLQAIWSIQDANYQRQLEALEKNIDAQGQLLEKQKEQTEKYSDAIRDIEGELADARGSRRQELIDQINAQMAAQRTSLEEEKRIEKEKERMEKQKEKMELEQKKREKKRSLTQAAINAAMAISMAAVNSWPIPAIPMMAMAAAVGAAQIAAVAKQKFAKGGLLQGPSHRQGGIPVGLTGIEVEGKEYVVRKESTAPNLPLLQYVNASKRKLTLDDFIDFYSSPKMRKEMTKTHFAAGGQLPSVSAQSLNDNRILAAIQQYAERPTVVAVSEINRVQDKVKNVQVLAGL